jgi:hypothetical protein
MDHDYNDYDDDDDDDDDDSDNIRINLPSNKQREWI